jgi:hypothetical protein
MSHPAFGRIEQRTRDRCKPVESHGASEQLSRRGERRHAGSIAARPAFPVTERFQMVPWLCKRGGQ